jgi:translation initiation factor 1
MDWKDTLKTTFSDALAALPAEDAPQNPPKKERLLVELDKRSKGKTATLVSGFLCSDAEVQRIAGILKNKCGAGGSVRDGEILVQGDFRRKISDILKGMNYQKVLSK